ncbi:MAG: acyltransferase [Sulfurimonas sp.]|nr:acyltransferase [Sulfurimonas sp.]
MMYLPQSSKIAGNAILLGKIEKDRLRIGPKTLIESNAIISIGPQKSEHISIGADCRIRSGSQIHTWGGTVSIGDCSSINANCVLYGTGTINIGTHVRIAANCVIVSSSHSFEETTATIHDQGFTALGITIENNVWIGANVTILDGVTIGTGAIVGAGSVVRKNVAPFTIVAGVPAKIIKTRISE